MNYFLLNFVVAAISVITTIAGIGGSCFYIPIYCLLEKKSITQSIPITLVTIFGDSLVRFFFLVFKKHPLSKNRYLINMPLVLLLSAFDSNSSFFGIILNNYLSNKVKGLILTIILSITFIKSVQKSYFIFKEEKKNKENITLLSIDGISYLIPNNHIIEYSEEKKIDYIKNIFVLIVVLTCVNIFIYCQNIFSSYKFFIMTLQFIFVYLFGDKFSKYLITDYENKKNNNFIFLPDDMKWNKINIFKLITIGSVCGFISTTFGIGGSMLLLPILINIGLSPYIAIACTSVTSFISSISSCYNYALHGMIDYHYALPLALSSGIGSFIGLILSEKLKLFKRQYILSFLISILLLLSIILINV